MRPAIYFAIGILIQFAIVFGVADAFVLLGAFLTITFVFVVGGWLR